MIASWADLSFVDKICVQLCCERLWANHPVATPALDDIVYQAETGSGALKSGIRAVMGSEKYVPIKLYKRDLGTGTPPPHEETHRNRSAAA